ncbi:MAG: glutamine--tRNA ligase/YqeY domain fusion protein [Pseudomonadales bacterium]|nr:glutamine--tRNA ligase/YqeY domain fusion protein [Pseudomonadales bacterium]
MNNTDTTSKSNFIRNIIDEDLRQGKHNGKVVTRFPPEPNGFLHIGHAKSICLNFGIAKDYAGGRCNLRFDDTNPEKESTEYVEAIKNDVHWLGFEWDGEVRFSSSYFEQLFDFAVELIEKGKAYVCSLTNEQMREYRGSLIKPGIDSPYRQRSIDENLDLFKRMRAGEFDDGAHVLRAKIDMSSPNLNMRDPILYRIRRVTHHRTGDKWCIYPMYDFTHCISDALEGITHSLCTLEFEDHRPLYDWVLDNISTPCHPQQIEFARLNLSHTITSKRKLKRLIDEGFVDGWDDPRLATISGLRRRGYTPVAIRKFCDNIGVTRSDGIVDTAMLVHSIREDLEINAPRAMCVLRPIKVVITNYPEAKEEKLTTQVHPDNPAMGQRILPFSREIYIDQDDFMEDPPAKFFRLAPGREVRLRNAYVIRCDEVVKDEQGKITELRCSYDDKTLGANPEGRKVKGVIHWVSVKHALPCEVRLYDQLFTEESPDSDDFLAHLNPQSVEILRNCQIEPSLSGAEPEQRFQFERLGYFCTDQYDSKPDKLVFNRTVGLRDSWAKAQSKKN